MSSKNYLCRAAESKNVTFLPRTDRLMREDEVGHRRHVARLLQEVGLTIAGQASGGGRRSWGKKRQNQAWWPNAQTPGRGEAAERCGEDYFVPRPKQNGSFLEEPID